MCVEGLLNEVCGPSQPRCHLGGGHRKPSGCQHTKERCDWRSRHVIGECGEAEVSVSLAAASQHAHHSLAQSDRRAGSRARRGSSDDPPPAAIVYQDQCSRSYKGERDESSPGRSERAFKPCIRTSTGPNDATCSRDASPSDSRRCVIRHDGVCHCDQVVEPRPTRTRAAEVRILAERRLSQKDSQAGKGSIIRVSSERRCDERMAAEDVHQVVDVHCSQLWAVLVDPKSRRQIGVETSLSREVPNVRVHLARDVARHEDSESAAHGRCEHPALGRLDESSPAEHVVPEHIGVDRHGADALAPRGRQVPRGRVGCWGRHPTIVAAPPRPSGRMFAPECRGPARRLSGRLSALRYANICSDGTSAAGKPGAAQWLTRRVTIATTATNMGITPLDEHDPRRAIALFTLREAAEYLSLPPSTLGHWARDRDRPKPPLVSSFSEARGVPALAFVGLAEAYVLSSFRKAGVPMQRIRPALERLKAEVGLDYALASGHLYTDGREVLFNFALSAGDEVRRVLTEVRSGQTVFESIIKDYLHCVHWDSDLWPDRIHLPGFRVADVIVDVRRAYGRPIVVSGDARVEDLVGRFLGGDSITEIAGDFGVSPEEVEDAVRVSVRAKAA